MRVLLAGGGSGGSAAPVLAVAEAMLRMRPDVECMYVGTVAGPEAALVRAAGLAFTPMRAGRLRRFATWRNLTDPGLALLGVAQAVGVVRRFHPDVAFGAGGFATVPPLLAACLLRVPISIHQQDLLPGLANRILAPFATQLTVAFPETRRSFRTSAARVVGNPVRASVLRGDRDRARKRFNLLAGVPTVLVTGGGTGALRLNELAVEAARDLVEPCQIIHLTGAGKGSRDLSHPRYHQYEFLVEEMADALAIADVVLTRAGMSALSEISALAKPAIVVPMPDSHQEANAAVFARHGAGVVLEERELTASVLAEHVRRLLDDAAGRASLAEAAARLLPADAAEAIAAGLGEIGLRPQG